MIQKSNEPIKDGTSSSIAFISRNEIPTDVDKKSKATENTPQAVPSTVTVREGETLSGIILHNYGLYNDRILNEVMRENTQLQHPDKIRMGRKIRLPMLDEILASPADKTFSRIPEESTQEGHLRRATH
jgi:hypothetical protein